MNKKPAIPTDSGAIPVAALVCYYLTLAAYAAGAYFPEYRVWGVNLWGYMPHGISLSVLVVAALIAPALILVRRDRLQAHPVEAPAVRKDRSWLAISLAAVAFFGALFVIFANRAHFLGDGYSALTALAEPEPVIKYREVGEYFVHIWLKAILPGEPMEAALASFRVVSVFSGMVFVAAAAFAAGRLFSGATDRLVFLLGCVTGGYMLLFFGYVEYYSLFVLAVGIYCLASLLALNDKLSRWLIVLPLALAIVFHVFGTILIPSAIYLILSSGPLARRISRISPAVKAALVSLVVIAAALVFYRFYTTNYFFRFAFLPVTDVVPAVDGYTLFSMKHISDYANMLILLLPGLLVLAAATMRLPWRKIRFNKLYRFLAVLASSCWLATFIFDPRLGMPRDWDLFSFGGLSLVMGGFYLIIDNKKNIRMYARVATLAIILGLVAMSGRVATQMTPETAIVQFKNHIELDKTKNRNGQAVLINYYSDMGDTVSAEIEYDRRQREYPQLGMYEQAQGLMNSGRFGEAQRLLKQTVSIDALYWNAWTNLGACYLHLKKYDSALAVLNISRGLNPFRSLVHNHLGYAYYNLRQFDEAEKMWSKSLELDSLSLGSWVGLANLSATRRQQDKYVYCLTRAASLEDVTFDVLQKLGDVYLKLGKYRIAAALYQRSIEKGLDTNYVRRLEIEYPGLRQ
ncbi:MAG: tetratricopeptide repeat protein [candidate division Zixibacteria bacterium]|nr:tetratricopeptide repeat protein [candidate division Zixibacteria bacterium]